MIKRTATIRNAQGIHCRPAAAIIKEALQYPCKISIQAPSGDCDCRSMMGLLSLGLHEGTEIQLEVEGPDEEKVCAHMVEIFERHFDFPPREMD